MPQQKFTNSAIGTLLAGIDNAVTSLSVQSGEGVLFPAIVAGQYFLCTIVDNLSSPTKIEIIKVINKATDTFTIVRNFEPVAGFSGPYAFGVNAFVDHRLTAATLTDNGAGLDYHDIDAGFNHAYATGSSDLAYSGSDLITVTVYSHLTLRTVTEKLYTKTLTYATSDAGYFDGSLKSITTVDEKSGATLTTTLSYTDDTETGVVSKVDKVVS